MKGRAKKERGEERKKLGREDGRESRKEDRNEGRREDRKGGSSEEVRTDGGGGRKGGKETGRQGVMVFQSVAIRGLRNPWSTNPSSLNPCPPQPVVSQSALSQPWSPNRVTLGSYGSYGR